MPIETVAINMASHYFAIIFANAADNGFLGMIDAAFEQ